MQGYWRTLALAILVGCYVAEAKTFGHVKGDDEENNPRLAADGGGGIAPKLLPLDEEIKPNENEEHAIAGLSKRNMYDWFLFNKVDIKSFSLNGGEKRTYNYDFEKRYSGLFVEYQAISPAYLVFRCILYIRRSYNCEAGYLQLGIGRRVAGYCGAYGTTGDINAGSTLVIYGQKHWGSNAGYARCSISAVLPAGASTAAASTATPTTTPATTTAATTTAATTTAATTTAATTTPATTTAATTTAATTTPAATTTTSTAPTTTTAPTSPSTCVCGKVNTVARIVGGADTIANEYPWQINLVGTGSISPFCGGSIINRQYILTAAHCVVDSDDGTTISASSIQVTVGDHNTQTTESTQQTFNVESITVHSGYNKDTIDNDIAIIKLANKIDFPTNNKIAPVCLPTSSTEQYVDVPAIVSGWGLLNENAQLTSTILQDVSIQTFPNTVCSGQYNGITSNMLCAGVIAGGKDSCQGDSGGPLVTDSSGSMVQIGIVSWGSGCARPNRLGVYTRVTNYLDWIIANSQGGVSCTLPA